MEETSPDSQASSPTAGVQHPPLSNSTIEDVAEDAAVDTRERHGIDNFNVEDVGVDAADDTTEGHRISRKMKWVYRKAFSLDLPVEDGTEAGRDADRCSFGFMLGYIWNCISTFLFVYEMVSVGLLSADLLKGSSNKNNVLGAFTVALMVLPSLVMGVIVGALLQGRALADCSRQTVFGVARFWMNNGSSCVSTVYGDTRSCVGTSGMCSKIAYFRVVKNLGSSFRTVTSSPLDCFLGVILSPFVLILWTTFAAFMVVLISFVIVCEAMLVIGGATAFLLMVTTFFVFFLVIYIGLLSVIIGSMAVFSVVMDIVPIFCWISSPWGSAVLTVLGGRYRSFRGVVNAGLHSFPQAIVQVVLLTTSAHSNVSKPKIVKTIAIVVLSGSWAALTLYVQAREFCRNCGRPSTSLKFFVKEGLFYPIFKNENLTMQDLKDSNFRDKRTEITDIENRHHSNIMSTSGET